MAERSVNKVILIGRLGKDAEQKFTPSGVAVASYSIATSRRWKDPGSGEWKDATDWHNLVHWKTENVVAYLVKGAKVYIEGRLQTRSWEKDGKKHYMTEIVVENMILLGTPADKGAPSGADQYDKPKSSASSGKASPADPPFDPGLGITDEDVPF
jgi:single-strand DNA-binding protein